MFRKIISFILIVTFTLTSVAAPSMAQVLSSPVQNNFVETGLKPVSTILPSVPLFNGIKIYPQEPFRFDFIMNEVTSNEKRETGTDDRYALPVTRYAQVSNQELLKLVKYFMASLTVPEGDLWVNLSPYEPDRIVPQALGQTEMGRDLLAQDYILKQLTASLMNPEGESGKKFWEKVYEKVYGSQSFKVSESQSFKVSESQSLKVSESQSFKVSESQSLKVSESQSFKVSESQAQLSSSNTTTLSSQRKLGSILKSDITTENNGSRVKPGMTNKRVEEDGFDSIIESFNKVWIVPDNVEVYQNGDVAYIVSAKLKVMMESDYIAQQESQKLSSSNASIEDPVSFEDKSKENGFPTETFGNDSLEGRQDDGGVKDIIRSIIIPLIEDEVNNGEAFANLRQIFHSMILAKWYEQHFKNSILGQSYVDKNVTEGIGYEKVTSNEERETSTEDVRYALPVTRYQTINDIYTQYVAAFKSSVNQIIKEDYDPVTQTVVPRKYFVGGVQFKFDQAQMAAPVKLNVDQLNRVDQVIAVTLQNDNAMMNASEQEKVRERLMMTARLMKHGQSIELGVLLHYLGGKIGLLYLLINKFVNETESVKSATEALVRILENMKELGSGLRALVDIKDWNEQDMMVWSQGIARYVALADEMEHLYVEKVQPVVDEILLEGTHVRDQIFRQRQPEILEDLRLLNKIFSAMFEGFVLERLHKQNVSVASVTRDIETFLRPETHEWEKTGFIEWNIPDDLTFTVDPMLLKLAFARIISNAIHLYREGQKTVSRVVVTARQEGEDIVIDVLDDGAGFSDQVMEINSETGLAKAFDLDVTQRDSGTGFGLAFFKLVLRDHGGSVTIANDGLLSLRIPTVKGAKFTIRVPKGDQAMMTNSVRNGSSVVPAAERKRLIEEHFNDVYQKMLEDARWLVSRFWAIRGITLRLETLEPQTISLLDVSNHPQKISPFIVSLTREKQRIAQEYGLESSPMVVEEYVGRHQTLRIALNGDHRWYEARQSGYGVRAFVVQIPEGISIPEAEIRQDAYKFSLQHAVQDNIPLTDEIVTAGYLIYELDIADISYRDFILSSLSQLPRATTQELLKRVKHHLETGNLNAWDLETFEMVVDKLENDDAMMVESKLDPKERSLRMHMVSRLLGHGNGDFLSVMRYFFNSIIYLKKSLTEDQRLTQLPIDLEILRGETYDAFEMWSKQIKTFKDNPSEEELAQGESLLAKAIQHLEDSVPVFQNVFDQYQLSASNTEDQKSLTHISKSVSLINRYRKALLQDFINGSFEKQSVSMQAVIHQAIQNMNFNLKPRGNQDDPLTMNISDDVMVNVNENLMALAFTGVIDNHFTYFKQKKLTKIEIKAYADIQTNDVVIEILDDGKGFSDHMLGWDESRGVQKAFLLNQTERDRGTGLGLSFFEYVLRDHGGSVTIANEGLSSVTSLTGYGAKFTIRVPKGDKAMMATTFDQKLLIQQLQVRLPSLIERKHGHVFAVMDAMNFLIQNDFESLYQTFKDVSVDRKQYRNVFNQLYEIYQGLSEEGKNILQAMTILHDIGATQGDHDWTHNARSAKESGVILENLRYQRNFIEKVQKMVFYHGGFFNLGVDFLPKDFESMNEEEKDILLLFNVFDSSGRAEGNWLTPDIIQELMHLRKVKFNELLSNEKFYEYRLGNFLTPFLLLSAKDRQKNQEEITRILDQKGALTENFKFNWGYLIRSHIFALFQSIGKESPELFVDWVIQLNTIVEIQKRQHNIEKVVIDSDFDFMGLYPHQQKDQYTNKAIEVLKFNKDIPVDIFFVDGKLEIIIRLKDVVNSAMMSVKAPGGIDLNHLNMQTSGQAAKIQIPVFTGMTSGDPAVMNAPIHTLTPRILNIGTMKVCDFLSLNPDGSPKSTDHADNSDVVPVLALNREEWASGFIFV